MLKHCFRENRKHLSGGLTFVVVLLLIFFSPVNARESKARYFYDTELHSANADTVVVTWADSETSTYSREDWETFRNIEDEMYLHLSNLERSERRKFRRKLFYFIAGALVLVMLVGGAIMLWKKNVAGSDRFEESKQQGFGYELVGVNRYRIHHPRLEEKELKVKITPPQSITVRLDGEKL
ncbi:MAG: hypothetical protein ABEJ65_06660, partial [bacterium]